MTVTFFFAALRGVRAAATPFFMAVVLVGCGGSGAEDLVGGPVESTAAPATAVVVPTPLPEQAATPTPTSLPTVAIPTATPAPPTATPYVHVPHADGLIISPPTIAFGVVNDGDTLHPLTSLCARPDARALGAFDGGAVFIDPSAGTMTVDLDNRAGFVLTAEEDWTSKAVEVSEFEGGAAVHAQMRFTSDDVNAPGAWAEVSMLHGSAVPCGAPEGMVARITGDLHATLIANTAVLNGTIGGATPDMISEIVLRHREVDTLVFADMPGSLNDAAAQITARIVRAAGFRTHAPAHASVNSGAVLLFTAGTERTYEAGATFGVHAWGNDSVTARDLPPTVDAHQRVIQFYRDMGLPDPEGYYWVTVDAAPFTDIAPLTAEQISEHRIATLVPPRGEQPQ